MEHQFKPWKPVIVRDSDSQEWRANFFSHYKGNEEYPYYCIVGRYSQCLPAEGNEHLIGTRDDPERKLNIGDVVEVRDNNDQEWTTVRFIYESKDSKNRTMYSYMQCRHPKGGK